MVVVGIGRLPGRQLPEAQPQALAAGLAAEAGAQAAEPGVLARLVEVRVVDVRHPRETSQRAEGRAGDEFRAPRRSAWQMPPVRPRALTITIRAPLLRDDVPGLVERTCALLGAAPVAALRCEVAGVAADSVALDALARLALATRRAGCRTLPVTEPRRELCALVHFAGLEDVLLLVPPSGEIDGAARTADAEAPRTAGRSCRSPGRT